SRGTLLLLYLKCGLPLENQGSSKDTKGYGAKCWAYPCCVGIPLRLFDVRLQLLYLCTQLSKLKISVFHVDRCCWTSRGRWCGLRYCCVYRLCHPNVVPMETAEPSD